MIYLRRIWTDPRLNYEDITADWITLRNDTYRMWLPDVFFTNERDAWFHNITEDNHGNWMGPSGYIYYSAKYSVVEKITQTNIESIGQDIYMYVRITQRYTIKLGCPMDLRNYPLDRQSCSAELELFKHSVDRARLKWSVDPAPLDFPPYGIVLKTFSLIGTKADDCTKPYLIGNT